MHSDDPIGDIVEAPYQFRAARPDEIGAINELFFREYGRSYPYPIRELNHGGVYPVAVHMDTGEVVGFAKAVPVAGATDTHEFGGLIVHPDHRLNNVAKRLTFIRLDAVKTCGGRTMMSETVCYRPDVASQDNLLKRGFVAFGLQPGKYPDIQDDLLHGQAESVLMMVRSVSGITTGFGTRRVYLPRDYVGAVNSMMPSYTRERGWSTVVPGPMPSLRRHDGHQGERTRGASFVDIPINWPGALIAIGTFRNEGFRFACILPGFGGTANGHDFDYLRMYRHEPDLERTFDFDRVHVIDQLAGLRAFMAYERSSTNASHEDP